MTQNRPRKSMAERWEEDPIAGFVSPPQGLTEEQIVEFWKEDDYYVKEIDKILHDKSKHENPDVLETQLAKQRNLIKERSQIIPKYQKLAEENKKKGLV